MMLVVVVVVVMVLVIFSPLPPSSYTAAILASSGLWAADESLKHETINTDLLVTLYQSCLSHHSRVAKTTAWIVLYLVLLDACRSDERVQKLRKHGRPEDQQWWMG